MSSSTPLRFWSMLVRFFLFLPGVIDGSIGTSTISPKTQRHYSGKNGYHDVVVGVEKQLLLAVSKK